MKIKILAITSKTIRNQWFTSIILIISIGLFGFNKQLLPLMTVKSEINEINFPEEDISLIKRKLTDTKSPLDFLLSSSTYFSGSGNDLGISVSVDSQDNILVTGDTRSSNFPMQNAYNTTFGGGADVFVAKFTASGQLSWSTYLGGSSDDFGLSIGVDSQNNVLVTGYTGSNNFPMLNAYNATFGGGTDVFVAKFKASGQLSWSTYLGGSSNDLGWSVSVDSQDNVLVSGQTDSSNFPMLNAYNATFGELADVFVAKFTASGQLSWSTYLGGINDDSGRSIGVDSQDNVLVFGHTRSSNFPMRNAYNATFGGGWDVFLAKFKASGQLSWSTYLGGSSNDLGWSLSVDSQDNVLVTGDTLSSNFQVENIYNATFGGGWDGFLAKFTVSGQLSWSTYLGGSSSDSGRSVSLDSQDKVLVAGFTGSGNFPMRNAYNATFGGVEDVFLAKYTVSGQLSWSTYLGGSGDDLGRSVIIDSQDNVLVTGQTDSSNFPMQNAYNTTFGGGWDVFLAKLYDPFSDTDQDGLLNLEEYSMGLNFQDPDSDGDIMSDFYEIQIGLNPIDATDASLDLDLDGMPNVWEFQMGLNASDPNDGLLDQDNDNLSNMQEYFLNLNATDFDTDNDYLTDGEEVFIYFTDPTLKDSDGDTLEDGYEVFSSYTNPTNTDTDSDGIMDNEELDSGSDPNDPNSPEEKDEDMFGIDFTTLGLLTILVLTLTTQGLLVILIFRKKT